MSEEQQGEEIRKQAEIIEDTQSQQSSKEEGGTDQLEIDSLEKAEELLERARQQRLRMEADIDELQKVAATSSTSRSATTTTTKSSSSASDSTSGKQPDSENMMPLSAALSDLDQLRERVRALRGQITDLEGEKNNLRQEFANRGGESKVTVTTTTTRSGFNIDKSSPGDKQTPPSNSPSQNSPRGDAGPATGSPGSSIRVVKMTTTTTSSKRE